MNISECSKIIAVLSAHAPNHPVSDATVTAWSMAMDDVPYDAAQWAVREWLRHRKWFPFPSEIRDMLTEQLSGLPSVEDAWRLVLGRMRSTYPGHEAPAWHMPVEVRRAVEAMGGVHVLRMSQAPGIDAKRFAEIYGQYRERSLRETCIPDLWRRRLAAGGAGPTPIESRRAEA